MKNRKSHREKEKNMTFNEIHKLGYVQGIDDLIKSLDVSMVSIGYIKQKAEELKNK